MNYIDNISSSIDYIEEHLSEELNIEILAHVSGYSKYHFLRIFKEAVGITPADYLRKRRLAVIVEQMLSSQRFLSDIAFEYGFNSKENFDRAFKKEHGVAPSQVRAVSNSLRLYPKFTPCRQELALIPVITELAEINLVVYESSCDTPPQFWNQYNCEQRSKVLSGGRQDCVDYGISYWNQKLCYYIGILADEARGDLTGTMPFRIPAGIYAVFETPKATQNSYIDYVTRTWEFIEKKWLPASCYEKNGDIEFETYMESSRTYQEKIYIPVREVNRMKKQVNVTWDEIADPNGFLHSFAKSLTAVVKNSEYAALSEDIAAASGFAFRMWMAEQLCPSATSDWEYRSQKKWAENCGLQCSYAERLWGEDAVEEVRRNEAHKLICNAIDYGMGAVAWDLGVCEWGVITGYDDERQCYQVLEVTGERGEIAYTGLGKQEIPILNVLTVTGVKPKSSEELVRDTKNLAYQHLSGQEPCDNISGIKFYEAFLAYLRKEFTEDAAWSLKYYLATYAACKYSAWKFFEKYGEKELSFLYQEIYKNWSEALEIRTSKEDHSKEDKEHVIECMERAQKAETEAMNLMK